MAEHRIAGQPVRVFHRDSLWRPLEDDEPPEDYYDFTEEDYFRVARGYARPEPMFKTRAIRQQEAQEAAEKLGPVRVRFIFPEDLICETEFSATALVDALFLFLSALILPEAQEHVCLFTAPPKQFITNRQQTLFQANLVPHVHLYVEPLDPSVRMTLIKPEIRALRQDLVPESAAINLDEAPPSSPPPLPEKRPARSSPSDIDGKRVPKWFKLGKS